MNPAAPALRSAAILLTGHSGAGKTTMGRALLHRLEQSGIRNAVLIDGEDLRARLSRKYGHSLSDREEVMREILDISDREMKAGKIVIIATIAHRLAMRVDARVRLQPFFEVHLDCAVEACASRDIKGHYQRAFADEYDCFIGVTHPYEPSGSPELRIDTAKHSATEAEALLAGKVLAFLAQPLDKVRGQSRTMNFLRGLEDYLLDRYIEMPSIRSPQRRRADLLKNAPKSKPIVKMERASCSQLMLLYGGMDAYVGKKGHFSGMSPLDFLRRSGLFGRNLAWIRDPYGENFFKGTDETVTTHEALAEWTNDYIRSLAHVREVHAVGYSSGCYGAMMFGHLCRMQSVHAFAPRGARLEHAERDRAWLKNLLSVHNGVTQYHLWYAHDHKYDRAFSELFRDCPGVSIHVTREGGSRHSLIRYFAENRALPAILPAFKAAEKAARPEGTPEPSQVLQLAT